MTRFSGSKSIVLIGGFGVPNWGDEYILENEIKCLKAASASDLNFFVMTAN